MPVLPREESVYTYPLMKSDETAGAQAIVVTGVSSGIGHGIDATCWCTTGFGCSEACGGMRTRSGCRGELGSAFTPLLFDVTDAAAVEKGAARVRDALNGGRLAGR